MAVHYKDGKKNTYAKRGQNAVFSLVVRKVTTRL